MIENQGESNNFRVNSRVVFVMTKKVLIVFVLITAGCFSSIAQKIKYKDLFYLLNAKKYEEAEPFLRSFLSNPKETEHPNANFQLGILLQHNASSKDLLKDTDEKLMLMDSSVYYYEKAKLLITEKELKKNSDFYGDYYRRDMRTGKMGIKISDVQLDIDERIGELQVNIDKTKALKLRFNKAVSFYNRAFDEYAAIVNNHQDNRQFLLRSDASTLDQLQKMLTSYDSAMSNFGKYKILLIGIKFPGYNQRLEVKEVEDIRHDGTEKADFFESNVRVWNYNKWGEYVKKAIMNEILPVHSKIIDYDKQLEVLYNKVMNESQSVVKDLNGFGEELIGGHLKEYDPDPFPLAVFDLKKAELHYHSFVLDSLEPALLEPLGNQVLATERSLEYLHDVENQVTHHIAKFDLEEEALNYAGFVKERFTDVNGVKQFIESKKKFVVDEKLVRLTQLEEMKEKSKWLIYKSDSIPLFMDSTAVSSKKDQGNTYVNFGKATSGDSLVATYGIVYNEQSSAVYTSVVPANHTIETLNTKPITSTNLSFDSLPGLSSKTSVDQTGEMFVLIYNTVYNNEPTDAVLFRLDPNLSLSWFKEINLHYPPEDLSISGDFGVVAINYDLQSIDKSQGLQLISRVLFDSHTGENIKEKN